VNDHCAPYMKPQMQTWYLLKKELLSFFLTPIAYVFTLLFLVLSGIFTFYLGNFFERGQADLIPFFNFHPWLYLFFIPALTMSMWALERQMGTLELLMTLPITKSQAVLAKFLSGWLFSALVLVLTFPIWVTVSYLGTVDHGVVIASYIGSWLLAGTFLAIGSCISVLTRNQIVAFLLTMMLCFIFMVSDFPIVLDVFNGAPQWLIDAVASFSMLNHFHAISRGVLAFQDLAYFVLMILAWLFATVIMLDVKKAE
jgi:ABC-2 type transport system permease protein